MNLFRFIFGEKVKCERNAVPIHEQSHFNYRIRTVVLFGTTLAVFVGSRVTVFIYRSSIITGDIHIGMSDIKIIVGTVKICSEANGFFVGHLLDARGYNNLYIFYSDYMSFLDHI